MVGVLQVNPDGFGYLLNESGDGLGDLYISAENQGTAMHKDRVVARIIRDRVLPDRGRRSRANREGRVIKILVRANQTIVGTLQRSKNFYYVVPDEPALVHDIYVTGAARSDAAHAGGERQGGRPRWTLGTSPPQSGRRHHRGPGSGAGAGSRYPVDHPEA